MGIYQKYILPRLLDFGMGSADLEALRPGIVGKASGVVLEIGSGSGHNFPFYKNISKLYALDPFVEMAEMAKKRAETLPFPVEFVRAGAEHISLPDASVDTVVSTWTLCSVDNPAQVLREIARVLRVGGRFLFLDHGISPKPFFRTLQNILTPVTKHVTGNCHLNRNIGKLILDSGFILEKSEGFSERYKPLMYNTKGVAKISD